MLEGLRSAVSEQQKFQWANVLKLIGSTFARHGDVIEPSTLAEGDDKNWTWACVSASELLTTDLRLADSAIGFEHALQIDTLIRTLLSFAPSDPAIENFEERFERETFSAAQSTLRGMAIELCILMMFWLHKKTTTSTDAITPQALQIKQGVEEILEYQLLDRSANGRIPRAIIGRYLQLLFALDADWLKARVAAIFPTNDDSLRRAAWRAHVGHDRGPIAEFIDQLHDCYAEDIERLSEQNADRSFREFYQERLVDYILVLFLWDRLPQDLLDQFLRCAPGELRQHAIWFAGKEASRPSSEVSDSVKARALLYWEQRLEAAIRSPAREGFRSELGAIGQWCFLGTIDELWLSDQLAKMLENGFAPTDAYSVVNWLRKLSPHAVDRAVQILDLLLRHQGIAHWSYVTQRDVIRELLVEGLEKGTPQTIQRVQNVVSFLATLGETSYLDLASREVRS